MNDAPFRIEVTVDSLEAAILAHEEGVNRLELCSDILSGGTTSSPGLLQCVINQGVNNIHMLIRPRAGDFLYSKNEFELMKNECSFFVDSGCGGLVAGILTPDGEIDIPRNKELITLSKGKEFTFHRAFDMVRDPLRALEILIDLGVDRLLTSGQQRTALLGANLIRELQERAKGRITIMAGCGINAGNVLELAKITGVTDFHFSAQKKTQSRMTFVNPNVMMGEASKNQEYLTPTLDVKKLTAIRAQLNHFFKP